MAYSKPSPTGIKLFEDDDTPIVWTDKHHAAWSCGGFDAEFDLVCPFQSGSAYAVCWDSGFRACKESGNRTPAGRKRKPSKADMMIKINGVECGIYGSKRPTSRPFMTALTKKGFVFLPVENGKILHLTYPEGVMILIEALQRRENDSKSIDSLT